MPLHGRVGRVSRVVSPVSRFEETSVEVMLPAELPDLTPEVARVLLTIVLDATETPVLERGEEVTDER